MFLSSEEHVVSSKWFLRAARFWRNCNDSSQLDDMKQTEMRCSSPEAKHLSNGLKVTSLLLVIIILIAAFVPSTYPTSVRGVYIHTLDDQTCESVLEHLAEIGLNTIFIDIYGVTDVGRGICSTEKKGPWMGKSEEPEFTSEFSLDKTLAIAKRYAISVHATLSCFGGPGIDPTNESHRMHLREVVEYLLRYFPTIDGIHLDYVRYVDERGWEANGNTTAITTFVKSIRQETQGKMLSAALLPCSNQEDYDATRYQTGQDCRELSQYLDFVCPMAYHLSQRKPPEWVGLVGQFMSSISQRSCRVFPTVQAYYSFTGNVDLSGQRAENGSILNLTLEVPSTGMLQFDITLQNPESLRSLRIKDAYSREISSDQILRHERGSTSCSFILRADVAGTWTAELEIVSLPRQGETVTVHIHDLDEGFPGYHILRNTILLAMISSDGFCVFALNNLSREELEAIKDTTEMTCTTRQRYNAKNKNPEFLRVSLPRTTSVQPHRSRDWDTDLKLTDSNDPVKLQMLIFRSNRY